MYRDKPKRVYDPKDLTFTIFRNPFLLEWKGGRGISKAGMGIKVFTE